MKPSLILLFSSLLWLELCQPFTPLEAQEPNLPARQNEFSPSEHASGENIDEGIGFPGKLASFQIATRETGQTAGATTSDVQVESVKGDQTDKSKLAKEITKTISAEKETSDKWTVKLGGHVQLDYVNFAQASPAIVGDDNYFNYRRLRLVADGTGYDVFDFRLQLTLEPGSGSTSNVTATPDVKDAYISMNEIPWLGRVRLGNFFVPFSLEQVTNDTFNIFMERSIPTQSIFAVDREIGAALYNCIPNKRVTWSGGVFFDDINDTDKTRFDDNQGIRVCGRLTALPYWDHCNEGRKLWHIGTGILHTDDHDDSIRIRVRPQIQRGPFLLDTGTHPANSYTTGNIESALVWNQLTIQSEAFLSQLNMLDGTTAAISGMYIHGSWFLTGENRVFESFGQHGPQFGRNKPIRPFSLKPEKCGRGAWELKARWSQLDVNQINGGQYNDLSLGLNWYLTDRTRFMFDYIHPLTTSDSAFGRTSSDILAVRLDFNW